MCIQCDKCNKWLKVKNEIIKKYKKKSFFCRFAGKKCVEKKGLRKIVKRVLKKTEKRKKRVWLCKINRWFESYCTRWLSYNHNFIVLALKHFYDKFVWAPCHKIESPTKKSKFFCLSFPFLATRCRKIRRKDYVSWTPKEELKKDQTSTQLQPP